ncbi:protein phosphatase 2C domain-containing protein [Balneolaceae bacterium ANBcel3]|nr:protein phosphatase 2C domain-containing protein [Balneolaceae bacterium ANBcel3]
MKYYGLSFAGRRPSNQDSWIADTINGFTVLAVADGMGGHKGGETASRLAIEAIRKTLEQADSKQGASQLKSVMAELFERADKAIRDKTLSDSSLEGMGTTLTCVLVVEDTYVWGNIGDSRIYKVEGGQIVLLTRDHTYLQEYIDEFGPNVPEEISQKGHILSRALNGDGDKPDIYPFEESANTLEPDTAFILLSDGLISSKEVDYTQVIETILSGCKTVRETAEQLISHAFYQGSSDNCTVVIGHKSKFRQKRKRNAPYPYPPSDAGSYEAKIKKKGKNRIALYLLALLLLIALAGMMVFHLGNGQEFVSETGEHISESDAPQVTHENDPPENQVRTEPELVWHRGFTSVTEQIDYFHGNSLSWYEPETNEDVEYIIRVYQDNELVYEENTVVTSFSLNEAHGYESGKILIELSAVVEGEEIRPEVHQNVEVVFQK